MKIQIIGPSGSGKTTLGQFISKKLGINFIDTDSYYWKDLNNMIPNTTLEREIIFLNDLNVDNKNWIVAGSIFSWNKEHLTNKDIIVYLSIDEELRINRLINRMNAEVNLKKLDSEFLAWAKTYHTEVDKTKGGTYVCHMEELKIVKETMNAKILYLNGADSIEENCKKILEI